MTRSLGLDIGDKRIGVAVGDPSGVLATPVVVINRKNSEHDINAILILIKEYNVKRIIAGLPRSLDGSFGTQADKVKLFIEELSAHIQIPLELRDERLTTVSARRLLRDANISKSKRGIGDDSAAAAVLLQAYLDEKRE